MFESTSRIRTLVFVAAVLSAAPGVARAQDDALGSRVHAVLAWDFSTDYITPRGLHVEDQGVVAQPLMLVLWNLHASDRGPLADVTLTTGLWNSLHSHKAGFKPSRWNEIDPILALGMKFREGFTVDASTTAFYTPTDSYSTSTHVAFKVTFDNANLPGVALRPYAAYWFELHNKSTVVFNPLTSSEGSYLTLGATPTFKLGSAGSSLEVGAFANIVSSSFYQRFDGSNGGSGLALVSVAPKLSVPLKGLGVSRGAWTAYVGGNYYHLRNEGLLDGNEVLIAGGERKSNLTQLRAGFSVFF